MFSGHPIASLLAGQCVMMVIFSNQLVIWHRYSYLLSYYPTFPQFPLFFTLSYDSGIREERGFLKENLEARGNHILLKAEPIGTSLEVLIDYGHFMFSFYRYEISNFKFATEWNYNWSLIFSCSLVLISVVLSWLFYRQWSLLLGKGFHQ